VDVLLSWQVSWLAGHRLHPVFPKLIASVTYMDADSSLTVAGAAPALVRSNGFDLVAPASLLAPDELCLKNHDGRDYGG
jgi:hypothetical protein